MLVLVFGRLLICSALHCRFGRLELGAWGTGPWYAIGYFLVCVHCELWGFLLFHAVQKVHVVIHGETSVNAS